MTSIKVKNITCVLFEAIQRDLFRSAHFMYILSNKCLVIYANQQNIENRQHLMNVKVIGVVAITESAITIPLPNLVLWYYCLMLYSEYLNVIKKIGMNTFRAGCKTKNT